MKTPSAEDIKLENLKEGKFDETINRYCLDKDTIDLILSLFEKLQEPIKLTLKPDKFNFIYFYNVIQLSQSECINFTYSQDFIKAANNFLVSKGGDEYIINSEAIYYKIIKELIYNYRKFEENDFVITQPENVNDNNSIANIEKFIDKKYRNLYNEKKVRQKLNLPKNLFELDITKVRCLLLINSIRGKKLSNYNNMGNIINSLKIYCSYLDEETITEIKSIINAPSFMKEFLITKENYSDENKINFLYFFLIYILNEPKDLEGFSFIIKTRQILSELLKDKNKNQLLSDADMPKGTRDGLSTIIDILLPNIGNNIQEEKNDNSKILDVNEISTSNISQTHSFLKIVEVKKKKKAKEKEYISLTVVREKPDIPYEDIELFKLIERNETLSDYLNGIWKYGVSCCRSLKNMREKFLLF